VPRSQPSENADFIFNRDQPNSAADPTAAPWHEETVARERTRNELPPMPADPAEATSAARQRRSLMFSSTSRKEGGSRAETRVTDLSAMDSRPALPLASPAAKPADASLPTFEDAWPQSERPRGTEAPQRRGGRAPSTFTEPAGGPSGTERQPPAGLEEDQQAVTVLKSGIVDGMAYSLYSDGSIEAQMAEGMMRFASIDELRAHLDQRS
jgi:hypothetical protein